MKKLKLFTGLTVLTLLGFLSPVIAAQQVLSEIQNVSSSLSIEDQQLVDAAFEKLKGIIVPEKHFVLATIRTKTGKIYTGVNLKTIATRASVCAESIALAKAIEAADKDWDTLVVVALLPSPNGKPAPVIVSPCGICRELFYDYAPSTQVIISHQGIVKKVPLSEFLAYPYKR
jgi:cytidine deaminase